MRLGVAPARRDNGVMAPRRPILFALVLAIALGFVPRAAAQPESPPLPLDQQWAVFDIEMAEGQVRRNTISPGHPVCGITLGRGDDLVASVRVFPSLEYLSLDGTSDAGLAHLAGLDELGLWMDSGRPCMNQITS